MDRRGDFKFLYFASRMHSRPKYSIIIPVYNRPKEIDEILGSLTLQSYTNFEVLVIEDGSTIKCEEIVKSYTDRLDVRYFYKVNSGQGFSRNYGYERARGDYFIVFDSDCLIPPHYFEVVNKRLEKEYLDAFGGPDVAHQSFTPIQKAISYSMTSFLTTGGIRGKKRQLGPYHPRSFNMGISREVFEKTGGYILPRKGEDIEFSIRIIKAGFKTGLIADAFVFHKRRTSFAQFYKQLHFFGTARINIFRYHKSELKLVHFFPAGFTLFVLLMPLYYLISPFLFMVLITLFLVFELLNMIAAAIQNKSLAVGLYSAITSFIQLFAYGMGFLKEGIRFILRG